MDHPERLARIEQFGDAYQTVMETLKHCPESMWRYRAIPGGWTIQEIAIHLADSETHAFIRCRQAIAEPGSAARGYDEAAWASGLFYDRQNANDALELFRWLRKSTYGLLKLLPDSIWANWYEHSEHGKQTVDEWLVSYIEHIETHVAQIQDVYEAWLRQESRG
jgi:hypothetical protein